MRPDYDIIPYDDEIENEILNPTSSPDPVGEEIWNVWLDLYTIDLNK